jgi:hypothetical protein
MISADPMRQAATHGSMKPPSEYVTAIVNAQYRNAKAAAISVATLIGRLIEVFGILSCCWYSLESAHLECPSPQVAQLEKPVQS